MQQSLQMSRWRPLCKFVQAGFFVFVMMLRCSYMWQNFKSMLHFLEPFSLWHSSLAARAWGAYSSCVMDSGFPCKATWETGSPFAKADFKLPVTLWFHSCPCPFLSSHKNKHLWGMQLWLTLSAIRDLENLRPKYSVYFLIFRKKAFLHKNPFMTWCVLFYESLRGVFKPPLKSCYITSARNN